MSRKVIITCAVTGAIHTPSMSKALPVTPQEIADAAVEAAEAGAAIVHLHARNPKTGQPDQSPQAFAPFLKVIKQRSNCVINLTTGGAPTMTVDERVRPAATYKPEGASLNMGSMHFAFFGLLNRFSTSNMCLRRLRNPAPASSSSATTPLTSTTSNISSIRAS